MAKQSFFKALAGVRTEASVHLYIDNSPICSETGELQLTDYGISGIPVFQISRFATKALAKHRKVTARIDFLPALTEKEVSELLVKRFHTYGADKDCSQALIGLFNKKLIDVLLKESGIDLHLPAKKLGDGELRRLCETIRGLFVEIIGSKPVDAAQVCAGGIPVCEVEQETLESKFARAFILPEKCSILTGSAADTIYSGLGQAGLWREAMRQTPHEKQERNNRIYDTS